MQHQLSLFTAHTTVHDSAAVAFHTIKVGLVELDDDRVLGVDEPTELRLLSPRVLCADVSDEVGPVDHRPRRDTQVPHHVVR